MRRWARDFICCVDDVVPRICNATLRISVVLRCKFHFRFESVRFLSQHFPEKEIIVLRSTTRICCLVARCLGTKEDITRLLYSYIVMLTDFDMIFIGKGIKEMIYVLFILLNKFPQTSSWY
jgi:hypothetical protein